MNDVASRAAAGEPETLRSAAASEDPERRWLEEVYQRGAVQLTVRAVIVGMFLGAVMCLSNLYVVLKTGWSLGVTLTACILAYAIFRGLGVLRVSRRDFSMLENNAASSVASAAGYMTGGGNMAAVPALFVLTGIRPDTWSLVVWFAVIGALGVFVAIPLKRQLVNIDKLPFPTGMATAETIRALHEHEGGEGNKKAQLLLSAAGLGAVIAWLRDAKATWMPFNVPAHIGLPFKLRGVEAAKWSLTLDGSLILMGVGALMTFKTGWSLLLGGMLNYAVLAPAMVERGVIETVSYKAIVQYTLWPGAAILVSSSVLSFAFQWRSIARSFSGITAIFRKSKGPADAAPDPVAEVECPSWWFPAGFLLLAPVVVFLMGALFQIPWWAGLIALPLTLVTGVVGGRMTGETDITPTKAVGPLTQLVFGAMLPGNMVANIMGANVTGGVGLHASDLLTDLKCGYLLGGNPRQQFVAQLFGLVAGAAVVVPAYNLLIPTADIIGSADFPAPSVMVWAGVSKALSSGLGGLQPAARVALVVGFALGIGLTLLERWAPARVKPWIPSPNAIGISMVIPGANAIAMFTGGVIAEILRRRKPALAERTVVPISSGFIAGESLMGIAIAILVAIGVLSK
ncbi:OPT family oligopeptide transporter [Pendulispora albinea]|uniref:OPT/YSL family transporter n=1 Tax=Pendulispora albinea TaxID=2741071 RepID=A0ABZ2M8G4_9BACT